MLQSLLLLYFLIFFTSWHLFKFSHFSSVKKVLVPLVYAQDKTGSVLASFPVQTVYVYVLYCIVTVQTNHSCSS